MRSTDHKSGSIHRDLGGRPETLKRLSSGGTMQRLPSLPIREAGDSKESLIATPFTDEYPNTPAHANAKGHQSERRPLKHA